MDGDMEHRTYITDHGHFLLAQASNSLLLTAYVCPTRPFEYRHYSAIVRWPMVDIWFEADTPRQLLTALHHAEFLFHVACRTVIAPRGFALKHEPEYVDGRAVYHFISAAHWSELGYGKIAQYFNRTTNEKERRIARNC